MTRYSSTMYGYEEDVDYDDYYTASFAQDIPRMVILSPEQLDQQTRMRMSEHIEEYLQRCHSIFGKRPKCQDYLRMVPYCLPIHQVMIGQSSYAEDILPKYASAFAFDYRVHKSWTPTSQVLAQAMVMFHGCDIATSLSIISNSYLLLPRGIVLLNVIPYTRVHDQAQAKLSSYLAELLSNTHKSSHILRPRPILQCEFGDEAKITGDILWASVRRTKLPIKRVSVRNPVWISRTYASNTRTADDEGMPKMNKISMKLYSEYGAQSVVSGGAAPRFDRWNRYDADNLLSIRPMQTLSRVSMIAKEESIEGLRESFTNALKSMSYHRVPSKEEEGEGYEQAVLRYISECALKHTNATQEILKILIELSKSLKSTDRDQVENLISNCRTAVYAASYASSFFASIPGTISGDTSAVALSSTSVPPIVRVASFHGANNTKATEEETLEAGTHKAKGSKSGKGKKKEKSGKLVLRPTLGPSLASTTEASSSKEVLSLMQEESIADIIGDKYETTPSPVYASAPSHYGESVSDWGDNMYEGLSHASEIEMEEFSGGMDEQEKELIDAHKDAFAPKFKSPTIPEEKETEMSLEEHLPCSVEAEIPPPDTEYVRSEGTEAQEHATTNNAPTDRGANVENTGKVSAFKPKSGRRLKLGSPSPPNTPPKSRRK